MSSQAHQLTFAHTAIVFSMLMKVATQALLSQVSRQEVEQEVHEKLCRRCSRKGTGISTRSHETQIRKKMLSLCRSDFSCESQTCRRRSRKQHEASQSRSPEKL